MASGEKNKVMLNLNNLRMIVEYFSKTHNDGFGGAKKVDAESRAKQRRSIAKMARTNLEHLLEQLVRKIRVNFGSESEAYRFFDLSSGSMCRKEHFVFNVAFFNLDFEYSDVADLFDYLDTTKRGYIDEQEFTAFFDGCEGAWNCLKHDIMKSVLRKAEEGSLAGEITDIRYGLNTTEKIGPTDKDIFMPSHFFGHAKQNFQKRIVSSKKRTLSIIDRDGKPITPNEPQRTLIPFPTSEYTSKFPDHYENARKFELRGLSSGTRAASGKGSVWRSIDASEKENVM